MGPRAIFRSEFEKTIVLHIYFLENSKHFLNFRKKFLKFLKNRKKIKNSY